MKRVFITGVTGFVGSNLISYFSSKDNVEIIGHSRDLPRARLQYGNANVKLTGECSADIFSSLQVDCVVHLAGIAHDLSNRFVESDYFKVNFENSARTYDAFLKSNATQFIYFSSIKAA